MRPLKSEALAIVTEWKAFRSPDFKIKATLKTPLFLMVVTCMTQRWWLMPALNILHRPIILLMHFIDLASMHNRIRKNLLEAKMKT